MVEVTLVFADVRGGSADIVDIDTDKLVGHLKQAIAEQLKYSGKVSELQLFLAKKDRGAGDWLTESDVRGGVEDTTGLKPLDAVRARLGIVGLSSEDVGGVDEVEEAQGRGPVNVLVVVPDGAENNRKRKRIDGAPDAWIKAIKDEQVVVLPSTCDDLREYLLRALRVKVPLDDTLFHTASLGNTTGELSSLLEKVFEPEPRETLCHITAGILGCVIDPVGSGSEVTTENTYHHLWDSLTHCVTAEACVNRELSSIHESVNFNVCVFRGEEKASGALEVPAKELYAKLVWKHDAAPYIFGYAAVGLQVRLLAIMKDEMTERGAKAKTIETYYLGDLNGRISFFLALLNLSTLFRPVVDLIQPLDEPEFRIIERSNGVRIVFAEDCVMKTYPASMPSDDIIRNLWELHRQMKIHSVPNVVELKKTNTKKKHVKLAPVGQLSPPKNVHQLLTALRDILKALVALHAINLMHRDLRWENVLQYKEEGGKWFLIDFDDGALSPAVRTYHLKAESHAPEILSSPFHTIKVDIWSVGFLLKTSNIPDLPEELNTIEAECLQEDLTKRPTAGSLLKAIEALLGN